MKCIFLPLVAMSAWILPNAATLAQPVAPSPDWVDGAAAPAARSCQPDPAAEQSDPCYAADCGCGCQTNCPVLRKLIADVCRAVQVLVVGGDGVCSSCATTACQPTGGSGDRCAEAANGRPAAEGGIEIVPRESWPAEFKEVPPPERTTTSVMRLERDVYARQATARPTPAVASSGPDAAESAATPPQPVTAPRDRGRPKGGFTAYVTDLAD
ncbi:MAG: hypothetical protein A2W31_03545 [Planctomycetes bacterium RBG_16_64_10]|nr:MAG: hypothetical protein A2W31_03545 [Planctomycetes bacterium RBG_16_64_10]